MLNVQGMFAVGSVVSLAVFVPLGMVKFTIDLWRYRHASIPANAHLNYDGLVLAANGVILSVMCFLIFYLMHLRYRRSSRRSYEAAQQRNRSAKG